MAPDRKTEQLASAYRWCQSLVRSHYENFPVASVLLPHRLRQPVSALYAFSRIADDWADEGTWPADKRLQELDAMEAQLALIQSGSIADTPLYMALADSIHRHDLPISLFRDLLSAFRQDVTKKRYADFGDVMDYCRRSANPVGRLLLIIDKQATPRNMALSDAICSALQLINFLQDIDQDYQESDRIYLPENEMQQYSIDEQQIAERRNSYELRQLVLHQIKRAQQLLRSGSPLGNTLGGRFGLEIRAIILGGERILGKLAQQNNVFSRPRLRKSERIRIVWQAITSGFG